MSEMRIVGRTEDGTQLELIDGEGATHFLRITDNLKGLVNQPRLVAVAPSEGRTIFTVKEIQSRLRAGESAASISSTTDWSLDKIDRFSGPIMQERAYVIGLAIETQLRRESASPSLATATIAQLQPRGVDMTEVEWNTFRNEDGTWTIVLQYPHSQNSQKSGYGEANWIFDLDNRTLVADDEGARWISGDEKPSRPATPSHGMVFGSDQSTPAPRLTAFSESVTIIESVPLSVVPDVQEKKEEVKEEIAREIPNDAKKDGVTKRIRIPSWDDIMFGGKKDETTDEN